MGPEESALATGRTEAGSSSWVSCAQRSLGFLIVMDEASQNLICASEFSSDYWRRDLWMEEAWSIPVGNRRVIWSMYECRTSERKHTWKRHRGSKGFTDTCTCKLRAGPGKTRAADGLHLVRLACWRGCYLSLGTQNQVTWVQRRSGVMNSFCLGHTEFEIAHPVSPWSWDEPSLPFKLEKETRCWSVRVEAMTPSERIPKVTRWRLSLGLSNIQGGGWRWKSSRKRQRIEIEQGSQRIQQRMEGPEVSNRVFLTDSVVSEQNPYSLLETKPFWYLS